MTTVSATFSNGVIMKIKNSKAGYTHAWIVTFLHCEGKIKNVGSFSRSKELAVKARNSMQSKIENDKYGAKYISNEIVEVTA